MKTPSTGPGKRRRRPGCSVRANSANSTAPCLAQESAERARRGPLGPPAAWGAPLPTHSGPKWISFERTFLQETVLAQPRRERSLIYTPDHTAGLGQALLAPTRRGLTGAPQPRPARKARERRAQASGPTVASGAAPRLRGRGRPALPSGQGPRESAPARAPPPPGAARGRVGGPRGRWRAPAAAEAWGFLLCIHLFILFLVAALSLRRSAAFVSLPRVGARALGAPHGPLGRASPCGAGSLCLRLAGLSCPGRVEALDQGSNLCPRHRQASSQPLDLGMGLNL